MNQSLALAAAQYAATTSAASLIQGTLDPGVELPRPPHGVWIGGATTIKVKWKAGPSVGTKFKGTWDGALTPKQFDGKLRNGDTAALIKGAVEGC